MTHRRSLHGIVRILAVLALFLTPAMAPASTPPSEAASCPGNVAAFSYNGFFSGSFEAQASDVQGRLAAGGSVKINNYAVADKLTASEAGNSLIVGGDLSFANGRLYFGNAVVAGSANVGQPVRAGLAPGQSITDHAVLPIDFPAMQAQITRLSWLLTLLPVNGTYQSRYGGLYLRGAQSGALQVFDLPAELVLNAHTFDVQGIPSGATVVFNIRGANAGLKNVGLQSLAGIRRRVVFNFPEATSLTFSSVGIEGSVIAPLAALNNPQGNINGSIFAKSFKGPMQLNHHPFAGCLKVNQVPSALGQDLRTPEDTVLGIRLAASDPDRDALTYSVLAGPTHGTLSGTAPNLTYTPAAHFNGGDQFTFRVSDGKENSLAATVRITVTPVNDPPSAASQNLATLEDTPLPIELGGADVEGAALEFHVVVPPQHGSLSGDGGSLAYTPDPDFNGYDGFSFVSDDGEFDSPVATISIAVMPVNDAPIAHAQTLETGANASLPIVLTGTDPDGDVLSFEIVQAPAHGTLSGAGAGVVYRPAMNYRGPDQFAFVARDGELASEPAFVAITVVRPNQAPSIVSTPVEAGSEAGGYQYDVNAQDPDDDALAYSIDRAPAGLAIDPATGLLAGMLAGDLVQPVRAFNKQCFVIPNDATLEDGSGTVIAPLYLRVRRAINKASTYVAPQTLAWDRTNGCLGCHVQNQAMIGLQGSMERAEVDREAAEYLLDKILGSVQSDGSIRRSHPEHARTQTAFALWALSYTPDRARTLSARERGLQFFRARTQNAGSASFWTQDHASAWADSPQATTAIVALAASRYLQDISRLPGVTPAQLQLGLDLRALVPRLVEYHLGTSTLTNDNLLLALVMTGLGEMAPHVTDVALRARVIARLAEIDAKLRSRERAGGGWHRTSTGNADPLVSAWVGFALDELDPPLTDPVVLRNIEFLLAQQRADGTWPTNSGLFTTFLGTTGAVMAYLPVALEHLGNPDLTVGRLRLEHTARGSFLSAEALNRGLTDIDVTSTLRFIAGRELDGLPLGEVTVPALRSGESFWVSLPLVSEPTGDVTAIITADEAIEECVEDNNFSRASVIEVRASDPFGAFATQTFIANLEDTNSPPTITSQPIVDLKQGFGYEYRVTVADADVGDAHEFQLTAAPKGLFINELSGQLGYDSRELAVGTHDVVVRATDLRGASATQAFRLDVHPNGKPVITSTPGTSVQAGELYSYTVVATDPDGDELEYRLDGAPLTMTVDSATGLVQFTPESRHAGNQPVAVIADDRRGGTSRQAFTLTVTTPPPNQAPRITSTPIEFARPGVEYVYDVDASDGDGDALTYALGAAPAGMVIEAETGLIRWTPPLASSIEVIAVVVTDGRGGSAAQLFALESREAPNRAPVITSSPSPVAYAGVLYRYDVQASDPDGDALSYALVEAPAGTSIDDVTGRVEWTPAAGTTSARIAVLVRDVHGAGTIQAFTVTLAARAPVAVADAYEVRAGETLSVTAPGVLANDVDPDGLALRASLVTSPTRGTLELRPNGSFTYAPRAADAAPFAAQLEWAWSFSAGTAQLPFTPARFGPPQVGSTPTVADLDGDGAPEIIVPVRYRLVILSGQDGHVRFFTEGEDIKESAEVAVGDLEGDGRPDIVALSAGDGARLLAYEGNGTLKWASTVPSPTLAAAQLALADLDGDGTAEIVLPNGVPSSAGGNHGVSVFNFDGTLRWRSVDKGAGHFAYDHISPIVADLDLDGAPEIIGGHTVYANDGTVKWSADAIGEGATAVGNFDSDPYAELVLVHGDSVYLLEHDGRVKWGPVAGPGGTFGSGPPAVADLDDDGAPEIGVTGKSTYTVFETDGSVKWRAPIANQTNSGIGANGSTVFDFDGDGLPEIVHQNWDALSVLRGTDGALLWSTPLGRGFAYPVIADVDGDGEAEIVAGSAGGALDPGGYDGGIYVFGSATGQWTPARKIWNQYSYHLTNVLEDGTIPAHEQPNWLLPGLNNYRAGAVLPGEAAELADRFTYVASDGALESSPTGVRIRVRPRNSTPQVPGTPPLHAVANEHYVYAVQVSDPDPGDAFTYSLTAPPEGMTVSSLGVIDWTPATSQLGDHQIILGITDSSGRSGFQVYTLTVRLPGEVPENRAPRITSGPPRQIVRGDAYHYAVQAFDPDGDVLTYRLLDGPSGMSIGAASGLVVWPGAATLVGQHAVALEVSDRRGGVAAQSFDLTVKRTATNLPPQITSQPVFTAKVGRTYGYVPAAEDPDGDPLTWSLGSALPGMTVNPTTGAISWVPASTGSFIARLRVSDGLVLVEQAFGIEVVGAEVVLTSELEISPSTVLPGESLTVLASVSGEAGPVTLTATLDGQPFTLAPNTSLVLTAPSTLGTHCIVIDVADAYESDHLQSCFVVTDSIDTDPPFVQIDAPREGPNEQLLVVTAPHEVIATVIDENLTRWNLSLQERGAPPGEALEIAAGTTSIDGLQVGKLDPTLLRNGLYSLVLTGEDAAGNLSEDSVLVSIEGAMKLGNFSITFEDLNVSVAGLPIAVTRTYDTRQRHQNLDFGYGWSVDYTSVRVQESRRPGFAWLLNSYPSGPLGIIPKWCVESALGNVVSVALPDGSVEKFRAVATPECNQGVPFLAVELRFEPMEGTKGKLEALEDTTGYLINGMLSSLDDPGTPLDPDSYRYINAAGQEFTLDQFFGVREILEREGGNTVKFSRDGVIHSTGLSITFQRDSEGRISVATAPDGSAIHYEYSPQGDLRAVVDPKGNRTQFTYLTNPNVPPHYLEDFIDALGTRVARNEYDDEGRLIGIIDANGDRVVYDHDPDGRIERVKNKNGFTTTYLYNERGDVLVETNPLGKSIRRTYDRDGNTLSQADALGRTERWTYDSVGNVLTNTDPGGGVKRNVYGLFNQISTITDANNVVILRTAYKNVFLQGVPIYPGPLTSLTDGSGKSTLLFYDKSGELNGILDAAGGFNRYQTDSHGHMVYETDALGTRTEYVNDALGRSLEERVALTDANGQSRILVTRYTRDAKGNVLATERPDGSVVTMAYDANDRAISECDPLGRCTLIQYDTLGRVERVTYPDGSTERTTYDGNGNVLSETDRLGRVTRNVYDAADRLVEIIHPDATPSDQDNPRQRKVYDDADQLIADIDENGNKTEYAYNALGQVVKVIQPAIDGQRAELTTEYDLAGRRTREIDAKGQVTRFEYDGAGHLLRTIAAPIPGEPVSIVSTDYDGVGRKTAETDASGRIVRFAYDAAGQLERVVLPNPDTGNNPPLVNGTSPDSGTLSTTFAYDGLGNKIRQTDAEGRVTRWEYDVMGREIARILPEGQREEQSYDAAGELVSHTDFNGQTTHYEYDAAGRLSRIVYPNDAAESFGYDAAGQRVRTSDARGESTFAFDARGRVVRATDPSGARIDYQYDGVGNVTRKTSPHQTLENVYDARNRLVSVTRRSGSEAPLTTRYEHDANDNRSLLVGADGTRTEYTYDVRNRLRRLAKRSAGDALLASVRYDLDGGGRRTFVEEADAEGTLRTVRYAYDGAKRLEREAIDHADDVHDRVSEWSYDKVGNRLTQSLLLDGAAADVTTYGYDANDRLSVETDGSGTFTYGYDANGNVLRRSGPGVLVDYGYDDADRLVEARTADGTTRYAYDADNLRVQRVVTPVAGSAVTTHYLQDRTPAFAEVLEELSQLGTAAPALSATYTFGSELLAETRYAADGSAHHGFVQYDGLGSTRWLTDAAGALTDAIDYDAFGNVIARLGSTAIDHLYRGESFDPNTELYYLRARWMDPATGRFTQQDAFAGRNTDPFSLHRYAYANADPTNNVDPSGLFTLLELNMGQAIQQYIAREVATYMFDMIISTIVRSLLGVTDVKKLTPGPRAGNAGLAMLTVMLAEMCTAGKSRCLLRGIPTFITGRETPYVRAHIIGAELGGGTTSKDEVRPLPFFLVKGPTKSQLGGSRNDVKSRRSKHPCDGGYDGQNENCDEYPYAASLQGGEANWRAGYVSLHVIPAGDNQRQGNAAGRFYSKARVYPFAGFFLNTVGLGHTAYIDRSGHWHAL